MKKKRRIELKLDRGAKDRSTVIELLKGIDLERRSKVYYPKVRLKVIAERISKEEDRYNRLLKKDDKEFMMSRRIYKERVWDRNYLLFLIYKSLKFIIIIVIIFKKYREIKKQETSTSKSFISGERRLLEISRALVMKPSVLLVDEPSIGLEPRYISMVFEILKDLQQTEKKTIIMVEQNAKKGLEFADIGYVLVSGQIAIAGSGNDLLNNPDVGRLFLGG